MAFLFVYFIVIMLMFSFCTSFSSGLPKDFVQGSHFRPLLRVSSISGHRGFHSSLFLDRANIDGDTLKKSERSFTPEDTSTKVKRKKLKGKRAVVRWVKHFRWKKKKEHQRMTAEEKILYKLNKVSCCILSLLSI